MFDWIFFRMKQKRMFGSNLFYTREEREKKKEERKIFFEWPEVATSRMINDHVVIFLIYV